MHDRHQTSRRHRRWRNRGAHVSGAGLRRRNARAWLGHRAGDRRARQEVCDQLPSRLAARSGRRDIWLEDAAQAPDERAETACGHGRGAAKFREDQAEADRGLRRLSELSLALSRAGDGPADHHSRAKLGAWPREPALCQKRKVRRLRLRSSRPPAAWR